MSRASIWYHTSVNKYIPAVKLGSMTGMARRKFDNICSEIQWVDQLNKNPDEMSHAEYIWLLIDDMVKIINKHRED